MFEYSSGNSGELVLYRTEDGRNQIQMRAVGGTVWLTQAEMAELFETGIPNINKRIGQILEDGELTEATISSTEMVRQEGSRQVRRDVLVYNLDMILAVGYRVRSPRGIQFRQWATTTLREYLVKGFVLNDERLKNPGPDSFDYFDELLERIREIRASEKRFYQKVRDVFAATSADYRPDSEPARTFYATIQNKLLYAATRQTAAELILARCDPGKPNMGLTSWKGSRVRKADVSVAKNYLTSEEIGTLNLLTTQYLDFAELRARRRQQITMAEWVIATARFIEMNDLPVLPGLGRVTHAAAAAVSAERYEAFDVQRRALEALRADEEAEREMQELAQMEGNWDALDELSTAAEELEGER
ncbi:2-hydroxyacid dehydrogenase [Kitasatospora griseola]|uniref:2-hydroxyacid dehydrogenase n=1 Tax=Kitasatospora griseola TaxID=2064 RepID=A0A0D0N4X4_KITGR|nr:virulence RhuM family protein [Kitasatospora griseola]KIQ63150.1 2-hydroxyacid dehydrogenase [Kitasatospora griseola]